MFWHHMTSCVSCVFNLLHVEMVLSSKHVWFICFTDCMHLHGVNDISHSDLLLLTKYNVESHQKEKCPGHISPQNHKKHKNKRRIVFWHNKVFGLYFHDNVECLLHFHYCKMKRKKNAQSASHTVLENKKRRQICILCTCFEKVKMLEIFIIIIIMKYDWEDVFLRFTIALCLVSTMHHACLSSTYCTSWLLTMHFWEAWHIVIGFSVLMTWPRRGQFFALLYLDAGAIVQSSLSHRVHYRSISSASVTSYSACLWPLTFPIWALGSFTRCVRSTLFQSNLHFCFLSTQP